MALNDLILINSGKNASTQQSTAMRERFVLVDDWHWPMWQPTTLVLVVTFLGTTLYDMDRVNCGEDGRGNNNKQKKNRYHGYDT